MSNTNQKVFRLDVSRMESTEKNPLKIITSQFSFETIEVHFVNKSELVTIVMTTEQAEYLVKELGGDK